MADLKLRQSYSGYLLGRNGKTLLELKHDIEHGRVPSKDMEEGAFMDQLLFGGGNYQEIGVCTKRSGKEKGEQFVPDGYETADAREQRDAIRAQSMIPVLAREVDEGMAQAASVRETLLRHGMNVLSDHTHTRCLGEPLAMGKVGLFTQPKVLWPGRHGTLDALEILTNGSWRIVDTKLSQRCDEEWVAAQAAKMGWDVQAGAYFEGCVEGLGLDPEKFRGYGLCVCEKRSGLSMSAMHWLTPMYLGCGKALWEQCKTVWAQVIASGEWPGALDTKELHPPGFHVSRIFDRVDGSGAEDLSDIGLDMTGIEMVDNG